MKQLFYTLFCLALLGCNTPDDVQKPANLLPEGKMAQILADVHVMESLIEANLNYPDSAVMVYNKRHKEILQKHQVTSDAFYNTYNYYADNLVEMDRLYEAVLDTLTAREARLIAAKGGSPSKSPSSDPEAAPAPEDDRLREIDIPIRPRARLSRPEQIEDNE